jgi:hypothetical protein
MWSPKGIREAKIAVSTRGHWNSVRRFSSAHKCTFSRVIRTFRTSPTTLIDHLQLRGDEKSLYLHQLKLLHVHLFF